MTRAAGNTLYFVVPDGVDDPRRTSGGNVFDQRVRDGLRTIGWDVRMAQVDADAPSPADGVLADLPSGALVLIDGLIAGRSPEAIEAAADRLRIVALTHMVSAAFPGADARVVEGEQRALRSARRVIATSEWTRSELARRHVVPPEQVVVAHPGSDDAPAASGTPAGSALLCVGVVAPHKGQDILIEALAALGSDAAWTCTIAGPLDVCPDYAHDVETRAAAAGLGDRVTMTGVLGEDELDSAYQHADLVVAPSRVESYGMAIADALRRGIPVIASRVGGIPLTVESRAAVLVPPGEPLPLADALREWMRDADLRARLKRAARAGRAGLPHWSDTAEQIASTLAGVR
ncbi:MAG TPA: glycosyltransferase family 4 protein [Microbacterium sp.]|nr:glycosyltransferase family 4 protein [Microbacterium sp.]